MLNLTKVYGKVNTIKKNLFYGKDVTLKFYRTNTLILEISDNWYMSSHPEVNIAHRGKSIHSDPENITLAVADVNSVLTDTIAKATSVIKIKNVEYKLVNWETPKIGTQVWRFQLAPFKGALR